MTIYQVMLALTLVFTLIGAHQATTKLLNVLDGHLERFQGKLDVLLACQYEHNEKIDIILSKLV